MTSISSLLKKQGLLELEGLLEAAIIKDNLTSMLCEHYETFIAVEVCGLVSVCVYLPTNYKNEKSERKFNLSCGKLAKHVSIIKQLGHDYLIIGDFNCDFTDSDNPRTQVALGILPDGDKALNKDKNFTYCHNIGSVSNLDHTVTSIDVQNLSVSVLVDGTLSDHLSMSLQLKGPFPEVQKKEHQSSNLCKNCTKKLHTRSCCNPVLSTSGVIVYLKRLKSPSRY